MRLTNRTKTWAEASRRFWGERKESPSEGLRDAERSALLDAAPTFAPSAPEPQSLPTESPVEPSSLLTGDPTQQLLTALGRFQRQVIVADSGAPAEAWVDNCIDQIISGIQIAHVRGWKGVKEALTDTARVLQSYDEGGDASGAVAFLQDAYEILCLMVGDLIVDNVRSGVMDKWRERYARAVADLEQSGHSLIDDDTGVAPPPVRVAPPVSTAQVNSVPHNVTPFVPRAFVEQPADEAPGPLRDVYADVDTPDVTYGEDEYIDEETAYVDERDYGVAPEPEVSPFEEVAEEPAWEDEAPEAGLEVEEIEAEEEAVVYIEDTPDPDYEDEAPASAVCEASEPEDVFDEDEASPFDVPVEAALEAEDDSVSEFAGEMMDESPAALTATLQEDIEEEPELLADAMLGETVELPEQTEDESWLVLPEEDVSATTAEQGIVTAVSTEPAQYLFDELNESPAHEPQVEVTYIDELESDEPLDVVAEMIKAGAEAEQEAGVQTDAAPAVEEVAAEVPTAQAATKTEDTPEAILRHAQAAMMRGDVRDAKVLALQLAANMAKLEAQKAVQIVQDAVTRLTETDHAIEVADSDVSKAETRLMDTMQVREDREHEIDLKKSGIHGLEKRVDSVESAIQKLEDQIAKLRAQHELELEKLAEAQADLEVEREQERMLLEDLDRIQEAEQAASDTLELARTRAEQLRQQRLEREQAREACEQMLARQRESAENIERTLEAVLGRQT